MSDMDYPTDWHILQMDETPPANDSATISGYSLTASQQHHCRIYYLLIRVLIAGVLVILGVVGNILTLIVMKRVPRPSATIRALLYLAIADLLVILQYGLMSVSVPMLGFLKMPRRATYLQMNFLMYLMPVGQITNLISVLITVIVTWQRYISVCHPHKAHVYGSPRIINIQVLCICLFSIVFHLPMFFQDHLSPAGTDPGFIPVRNHFSRRKSYTIFYSIVLVQIIRYIIPIICLIYMSICLLQKLSDTTLKNRLPESRCQRARKEMTISLMFVVFIFIICQSFAPMRQILILVHRPYSSAIQCGGPLFYFGPFDLISIIANSSANFFIFVVCARGFREKLMSLIRTKANNQFPIWDVDPEQSHLCQAESINNGINV